MFSLSLLLACILETLYCKSFCLFSIILILCDWSSIFLFMSTSWVFICCNWVPVFWLILDTCCSIVFILVSNPSTCIFISFTFFFNSLFPLFDIFSTKLENVMSSFCCCSALMLLPNNKGIILSIIICFFIIFDLF